MDALNPWLHRRFDLLEMVGRPPAAVIRYSDDIQIGWESAAEFVLEHASNNESFFNHLVEENLIEFRESQ